MLAAAGGRDFRGRGFSEGSWRPTLHDLTSPALGYSNNLQIEMMRVIGSPTATGQWTTLQSLHLFDALSLPGVQPMMAPLAWRLGLGLEREDFGGEHLRRYVEGGGGLAWAPADGPLTVFGLGLLQAGWSASWASHWLVEPAALAGALLSPSPTWRLAALWRPSRTDALSVAADQPHHHSVPRAARRASRRPPRRWTALISGRARRPSSSKKRDARRAPANRGAPPCGAGS